MRHDILEFKWIHTLSCNICKGTIKEYATRKAPNPCKECTSLIDNIRGKKIVITDPKKEWKI